MKKKYVVGGLIMAALVCAMIFFGGNGSKIVGKNIKINDINDFYYTLDGSTNPPYFQRYRFYINSGRKPIDLQSMG